MSGYVLESQPISVGRSAIAIHLAATAKYDLQPLSDDFGAGEADDDLLAGVLEESALTLLL